MTSVLPMIIGVGAVVVFMFIYMTFFHKKLNAKYAAASGEVQQKFNENKNSLIDGYLNDRNKFGILTEAIGPDEKILGIASYDEPKTIGKTLTEGLKTSITNVKKVNMDLFFIVITDKNIHCIDSNGENTVDHTVFDLGAVEQAKCGKPSMFNVKNAVTGASSGDFNCLEFTYKDKKYSYNLYKYLPWYPQFKVSKDVMSGQFVRSFPGQEYTKVKVSDPAYMMENMCLNHFYEGFKGAAKDKLGVIVP